jgi:hypothetical protein
MVVMLYLYFVRQHHARFSRLGQQDSVSKPFFDRGRYRGVDEQLPFVAWNNFLSWHGPITSLCGGAQQLPFVAWPNNFFFWPLQNTGPPLLKRLKPSRKI